VQQTNKDKNIHGCVNQPFPNPGSSFWPLLQLGTPGLVLSRATRDPPHSGGRLFDTCSTKSRGGHAKACSPLGTYLKVIVHSQSRAIVQTLVCQAPFPSRLQRRRLNKAIMRRTETPDSDCMYSTARPCGIDPRGSRQSMDPVSKPRHAAAQQKEHQHAPQVQRSGRCILWYRVSGWISPAVHLPLHLGAHRPAL
jgi:hypothetical protein